MVIYAVEVVRVPERGRPTSSLFYRRGPASDYNQDLQALAPKKATIHVLRHCNRSSLVKYHLRIQFRSILMDAEVNDVIKLAKH